MTDNQTKPRIKALLKDASDGDFLNSEQQSTLTNLSLLILAWPEADHRMKFIEHHISNVKDIEQIKSSGNYNKAITHLTKAYLGLECYKKHDGISEETSILDAELDQHLRAITDAFEADVAQNPFDRATQLDNDGIKQTSDVLDKLKEFALTHSCTAAERYKDLSPHVRSLLQDASLNS